MSVDLVRFLFYGSSHDSICRGIVFDGFIGLLWMAHISQGCPKCLEFFVIVEYLPTLRLRCRRHYITNDGQYDHNCSILSVSVIDCFSHVEKPPDLLLACDSEKYDASLCVLSTIPLALYRSVALGCVS